MKLRKRIIFVFIILLFILVINAAIFFGNIYIINQNEELIHSSHDITYVLQTINATHKDADLAQRNYIRTNKQIYLDQYLNSDARIHEQFATLNELVKPDQNRYTQFLELQSLVLQDQDIFQSSIHEFQNNLRAQSSDILISEIQKQKTADIERVLNTMLLQEQTKSNRAVQNFSQSIYTTLVNFFAISSLDFLLIILGYYLFQRDYQQREFLRQSENRYRKLIDANIIGVLITTFNGSIIDANNSFLRLIGYSRPEMQLGLLKWEKLTPKKFHSQDQKMISELKMPGSAETWEKEFIHKNGHRIPVLVGAATLNEARDELVAFVLDISKIKVAEEELKKSKDQLEIIFQNVADGVTVQNAHGKLTYINEAGAQLIGFPNTQSVMKAIRTGEFNKRMADFKMFAENGQRLMNKDLPEQQVLRGASYAEATIQYFDKSSGTQRWSLVKARPIFDDKNKLQFIVNIVIDITEAKELEKRKDEFISVASHELKTPITTIKAYTQLLEHHFQKIQDKQAILYIEKVDAYLHKLTGLVGDLLDVSKIQAGKLQFHLEEMDFDELVKNCIDDIQPTTNTHQIRLTGETKQIVRVDRIRIEQVINNLLSNAIKYSPQTNKILVNLTTEGKEVILAVKDYGLGIPKSKQKKIFEKFYRASETSKGFSGLGIGLYISQQIVSRHSGKIWVESQKGKGATFYFTLPIASKKKKKKS